jgi:hypothetical protein
VEGDVTESLGTRGGQIADEAIGLTAAAEEVVAAGRELVWDLVADVTRVGGWSPECIRAAWLGEPSRPQPGASHLRAGTAKAPRRAAEIIAARRDGLRSKMSATLRAMKAAAESSHATGVGPG